MQDTQTARLIKLAGWLAHCAAVCRDVLLLDARARARPNEVERHPVFLPRFPHTESNLSRVQKTLHVEMRAGCAIFCIRGARIQRRAPHTLVLFTRDAN
jgi:hypothetical protein